MSTPFMDIEHMKQNFEQLDPQFASLNQRISAIVL
jgi:hypothetical protein